MFDWMLGPGDSMLRLLLSFFVVASTTLCFSQTPNPNSTVETLHTGVRLVVVDVVVTDKDKKAVRGLSVGDFSILDDGKAQTIRSFEEHVSAASTGELKPAIVAQPGIFTNYTATPPGSAINVLLLDALNTPAVDQNYLKDQIRKFLKAATPGAPIAIFGLNTRLTLLQSFTSDPELLRAAINKRNTEFSALLDDPVTGVNQPKLSDFAAIADASNPTQGTKGGADPMAAALFSLKQDESQQATNIAALRARFTLQGLNQLARFLSGMPGRKNVIWFSGSFPINVAPDTNIPMPLDGASDAQESMYRQTVDLMTRAQIAIYPIDARGGMTSPVADVSQSQAKYSYAGMPTAFGDDQRSFHQKTQAENVTMLELASDTGGKAFLNDNDLSGAVHQAIDLGSNYYTITFAPSAEKWNGGYRRLNVEVKRPGVSLAYRRGYYADDLGASFKADTAKSDAGMTQVNNPMILAMRRGAPDPTEITLKVRVLPSDAKPDASAAKDNKPSAGVKGPYRTYVLDLAADPYAVQLTQAQDGVYHGYLQVLTYVYDKDGKLMDTVENLVRANFAPPAYAQVMKSGLPFHQEISVPVKGEYFLRVGLHDLSNNRVGAVEVPVANVRDLAPLTPQPIPLNRRGGSGGH
jgi:VWFA-related protein